MKKIKNAIRATLSNVFGFIFKLLGSVFGISILSILGLFVVIILTIMALILVIILGPLYALSESINYGSSFTKEYVDYIDDMIEEVLDAINSNKKSEETES